MQWNTGLSIHPDIVRHSPGISFYEIHPKKRVSFDHSTDLRSFLDGMKEPAIYERRMLRLFHHMMQFSLACTLKKARRFHGISVGMFGDREHFINNM